MPIDLLLVVVGAVEVVGALRKLGAGDGLELGLLHGELLDRPFLGGLSVLDHVLLNGYYGLWSALRCQDREGGACSWSNTGHHSGRGPRGEWGLESY